MLSVKFLLLSVKFLLEAYEVIFKEGVSFDQNLDVPLKLSV